MLDESEYGAIRERIRHVYGQREHIRCPALNGEMVHFTSEGFNHLIYKGDRSERDKGVHILKFNLFPLAQEILGMSTTFQEYDERLISVRKKKHKRIVNESAITKYWGLIAILKNRRVK